MEKISNWFYKDLKKTGSTNDAVIRFLKQVKTDCIVSAQVQTSGRGRLGRKWQQANGNLYVSFAFKIEPQNLGHMVILSAVAVVNTIQSFIQNEHIEIKWPNDVLVNTKKISGILFEKGPDDYWVMGIGVNIKTTPKVDNALYPITSLADFKVNIDRITFLKNLVQNFDALTAIYKHKGFENIRKSWLDKAYNRGKKIVVKQYNQELSGIFDSIDDNGWLVIKTQKGVQKIITGDVFGVK